MDRTHAAQSPIFSTPGALDRWWLTSCCWCRSCGIDRRPLQCITVQRQILSMMQVRWKPNHAYAEKRVLHLVGDVEEWEVVLLLRHTQTAQSAVSQTILNLQQCCDTLQSNAHMLHQHFAEPDTRQTIGSAPALGLQSSPTALPSDQCPWGCARTLHATANDRVLWHPAFKADLPILQFLADSCGAHCAELHHDLRQVCWPGNRKLGGKIQSCGVCAWGTHRAAG